MAGRERSPIERRLAGLRGASFVFLLEVAIVVALIGLAVTFAVVALAVT
jgi:hypothetical protein